jgi:uncharacterized repeat protein (TIGR02059 family)
MHLKKKRWGKYLAIALVFTFLFQCLGMVMPESASAATSSLTVTKYAIDGTTILDQKTVDYHWLEDPDNIPVMGDGTTRYYNQGPVFLDDPDEETEQLLRWNQAEDRNWAAKDMGAVKGTNVKDLCELVGGMENGDSIQIKASDGFKKTFAYENVYQYSDREGPMVVCWYQDGKYPDTGYTEGMRLVWFAEATPKAGETSLEGLPEGNYHVFGNWDWRLAADEEYWYYYTSGGEQYPTTSGLSVQYVSQLNIFSNEPVPTVAPLLQSSEVTTQGDVSLTFDQDMADPTGIGAESQFQVLVDGQTTTVASVVKTNTSTKIKLELATKVKGGQDVTAAYTKGSDESKQIKASDGGILQSFSAVSVTNGLATLTPPALTADSSDNTVGQAIDITFTDDESWRAAITGIMVNGSALAGTEYEVTEGNINIVAGAFTAAGDFEVAVKAPGYSKATVTQTMTSDAPAMDVLYDGIVTLTPDETFEVTAYNSSAVYTVVKTTALGALQVAAEEGDFTYDVSDKRWTEDGVLLLDNAGGYNRSSPGKWYAYVNDVYKDGYMNTPDGLNVIELTDGDRVEFYYAAGISDATDLNAVKAAATAAVKTKADISAMDVLYDGTVTLTPDETFEVTAYNSSAVYTVAKTTPLGALQAAAAAAGFTYGVTDKNHASSGALLLDNVATYLRDSSNKAYWYAYVNNVYKDGYNNAEAALNLMELAHGDRVEYYYAANVSDATDLNAVKAAATAAVKTVASTGVAPTDWTLQLSGAKNTSVNKAYFENGLACASSSHQVSWTDDKGTPDTSDDEIWGGVPLWLLVGMVDDDPDVGDYHYNFNDELADQHYQVEVIAGDGWKATLDSADIARNDGYIIANTLNGEPLPLQTDSGKGCWPLHLKGSAIFGGQQVGNIVRIELVNLPEPPAGWTLEMVGQIGDTITQQEFEEALACTGSGHYQEWTDNTGKVWSGVPLWVLLGAVDDIESSSHWTFNDTLAESYTVKVSAADFSKTFNGTDVARSDDYIVANKYDGQPLTDSGPLRLVGNGVVKEDGSLGGSSVGSIVKIEIPELQTPEPAAGSWNLTLKGKISDVISQAEFETALACPNSGHSVSWTDADDNVWSGMPLWLLTGWVDDRQPHDYDANQAMAGYTILVKAGDKYTKDFSSKDVAWSNNYIIANKCNGQPLTGSWPLRLVGDGVASDGALTGFSVGNIAEIELTSFETSQVIPQVHVIKYGEDNVTVIDEITVDYLWMQNESGLDVIGDGTTVYKYEGITNNPDDLWDEDETYPGGFKIANAVKGTRIKDLCDQVGGMGTGTEVVLVAKDGYESRLPYSSIYTDPSVQARQGDAILAWYADGKYVPDYADGMRLFFTPEDHVYGQWDMHETLPENYWHYYYDSGNKIMYPSCAGLSAKYITEIKVYSVPQGDWTLKLDGKDIGGLQADISKTYFESALTCQFGANHKASYTDSEGQVWEGMPLWFLLGFVDDLDQHSSNAFNADLAQAGYQVVITADDGYSVTLDSKDIGRNNNYIVANSLNGQTLPDDDDNWPLRLVGTAVSGETSIARIVSIELIGTGTGGIYSLSPAADDNYTPGTTVDGINTMTVKAGVSGFKYFAVEITPLVAHAGNETVVFTHLRNGIQQGINATRADFDQVSTAQAGFNVQAGDVIKVYIVDELTNKEEVNPIVLQ